MIGPLPSAWPHPVSLTLPEFEKNKAPLYPPRAPPSPLLQEALIDAFRRT